MFSVRRRYLFALLPLASAMLAAAPTRAADPPANPPTTLSPARKAFIGRWDLTVTDGTRTAPSWLEVELSGRTTLVGRYVAQSGSARPISKVEFSGDQMRFTLPVQWEQGPHDLQFEARLQNDRLSGRFRNEKGKWISWTGVRAPRLASTAEPSWGAPIDLFDGKSLQGWRPRNVNSPNGWVVENGLLKNARPGNDLLTTRNFGDFRLHAEFRYPKGSNSGIYLRGRYEAQIEDNYGQEPTSHRIGGIYGFLTPRINAARPAGEWQSYDITLVGRRITVTLNGGTVVDRQEIPGITGGALDSEEGEPGPILLQGDHGPVEFRKLTLTPAQN